MVETKAIAIAKAHLKSDLQEVCTLMFGCRTVGFQIPTVGVEFAFYSGVGKLPAA